VADGWQGCNIQIIAGRLDINGVYLFTTSISHLKAATSIRLVEGGVFSPKNLGLGSPRKVRNWSGVGGTQVFMRVLDGWWDEELVGPGPSKMSESSMYWTVALPIGWGPVDSTRRSSSSTSSRRQIVGDPIWWVGPQAVRDL